LRNPQTAPHRRHRQLQILPPVAVIATSPLPGLGIDRDKVPSNAQSLPAPQVTTEGPTSFTTQLNQRVGNINIEENQGNPFQPDVLYRGFEGSPILGTPIGIAVYQNGVRLNEPFGDNINWDLIPNFAINSSSIIPTNPVYGLNALGGVPRPRHSRANLRSPSRSASVIDRLLKNQNPLENRDNL